MRTPGVSAAFLLAAALLSLLCPRCSASDAACKWRMEHQSAADGGSPPDSVDCTLRTLDFRRNSTDSVLAPILTSDSGDGRVLRRLRVSCSDVFFFESQLRSDHFGDLPDLTSLDVRFCKIRQLPPRAFVGLRGLSSLSVRTHNAEWTSIVLSPDYESLVGLAKLETLDLSQNNLRELPSGLLCPLASLHSANLSANAFSDLARLGLGGSDGDCNVPLQSLDLRHNNLESATPGALTVVSSTLSHLDLSQNSLSVLVEGALKGLAALETLDLSHNSLASVPPRLFWSAPKLKELHLSNNTVGTIDLDAFSNLTSLQVLNLSGNRLDENWIKAGIFDGLESLILLDLSSNHISRLDSNLLKDLGSLQVLNLAHNSLRTLSSHALSSLSNLHALSLSHNALETLHKHSLSGLPVLHSLALDHNGLHSVHPATLRNCSGIAEISLSNNFLTQVPEALTSLPSLTTLDLSSNVIGVLKRSSLLGLTGLTGLKIGRNELSRLGEGAFKEAPSVRHLDLGGNRFRSLAQETFAPLARGLESLNLAENQLEDVNGLLHALTRMVWLNVSSNNLAWFDYAFVPPSVEWLDVAGNQIDALGNYYGLTDNYGLKYLDASRNRIAAVTAAGVLPSLEHVFLADNLIEVVEDGAFAGKYALRQVHLERNRIRTLDREALFVTTPQTDPPAFFLSGNPFVCDCKMQWLKRLSASTAGGGLGGNPRDTRFPQVLDLDRARCRVTDHGGAVREGQLLTRARDEEFLCPYAKHCLPGCLCCDYLACDCQAKCPDGCSCLRDQGWDENVVQCSGAGFPREVGGGTVVGPEVVPMDATVLYLDGNNLTELSSGMLVGRTRLRTLSVAGSQVATIANGSFAGLGSSLQVLNLARNLLQRLRGHEFAGLSALRELYLQKNQLVSMAADSFRPLRHLSVLRLDGNLLISFPIWQLSSNPALSTLTLADNWWQCDCDFVRKFRMFIDGNADIIPDAARITCSVPGGGDDAGEKDSSSSDLNQCSGFLSSGRGAVGVYTSVSGGVTETLPLVVGVAAAAIMLAVALFILVKMRESLLIWLHSKHGIRLAPSSSNKKKSAAAAVGSVTSSEDQLLFEALLVYSAKDERFVVDELARPLESTGYRLCLLHRDLAGIYTSEAFKSALSASARIVVVVSQAFFAGEWEYVKDLGLEGLDCVVVALGADPPASADRAEASAVMRSARKVLKWAEGGGELEFWRALKYHLPDPSKSAKSTKEGGAELDVSGVWTFTNMEGGEDDNSVVPTSNVNDTGVSTARLLLSTPSSPAARISTTVGVGGVGGGVYSASSTPLLSMLAQQQQHRNPVSSSSNTALFPAPPVRKQPHQCSTHYLAGAPSACSHHHHRPHQRSVSNGDFRNSHSPSSSSTASSSCNNHHTRSRGTNAVSSSNSPASRAAASSHPHLRSVSAVVNGASSSLLATAIPPTPPPKQKLPNSFYNQQQPQQPQPRQESIYNTPASTFLSQLMASVTAPPQCPPPPHPDDVLLLRPPPVGQDDPPPPDGSGGDPSSSLALIPLRAAAKERGVKRTSSPSQQHKRSTSLFDHQQQSQQQQQQPVGRHGRSTSTFVPAPAPAAHRRSSSGVTRTSSMMAASAGAAAPPQRRQQRASASTLAAQHHRSALDLMAREELMHAAPMMAMAQQQRRQQGRQQSLYAAPAHARSKSTPFQQGFVL